MYHAVFSSMSFRFVDCLNYNETQIILSKYQVRSHWFKFSSLFAFSEQKNDLNSSAFFTVYFDAFKPENTKIVPILVGYYNAADGLLTRGLNVESVRGETSDILLTYISDTLCAKELSGKLYASVLIIPTQTSVELYEKGGATFSETLYLNLADH